jgi:hypothetical protein
MELILSVLDSILKLAQIAFYILSAITLFNNLIK